MSHWEYKQRLEAMGIRTVETTAAKKAKEPERLEVKLGRRGKVVACVTAPLWLPVIAVVGLVAGGAAVETIRQRVRIR